jgi:hypothetical protein
MRQQNHRSPVIECRDPETVRCWTRCNNSMPVSDLYTQQTVLPHTVQCTSASGGPLVLSGACTLCSVCVARCTSKAHQGVVLSDGVVREPAAVRQRVHAQTEVGAGAGNIPVMCCSYSRAAACLGAATVQAVMHVSGLLKPVCCKPCESHSHSVSRSVGSPGYRTARTCMRQCQAACTPRRTG